MMLKIKEPESFVFFCPFLLPHFCNGENNSLFSSQSIVLSVLQELPSRSPEVCTTFAIGIFKLATKLTKYTAGYQSDWQLNGLIEPQLADYLTSEL